jgi:hypothetical protein
MDFHIVKMYKDKAINKNVKNIFLSICNVKVFLTFTFVVKILQVTRGCWWRWFTIDEFGTALTTILFQYCFKYCYSDSRNLWEVILILILILKVAIDATGPRVLFFFSLVLYCLTVISPCTGVLSWLGSGSGYRAC